jgi:hypothetical protein
LNFNLTEAVVRRLAVAPDGENTHRLGAANKSLPTFAPARRRKSIVCTSQNCTTIAEKSDDFSADVAVSAPMCVVETLLPFS